MYDVSTRAAVPPPALPDDQPPTPPADGPADHAPSLTAVLSDLERAGWLVRRELRGRARSDSGIDVMLVGNRGIFLIDSHSSASGSTSARLDSPGAPPAAVVSQLQRIVSDLRGILPPLTRQYVVPVLVQFEGGPAPFVSGGVHVCTSSTFQQVVGGRMVVLTQSEVDQVDATLASHFVGAAVGATAHTPEVRPASIRPRLPSQGSSDLQGKFAPTATRETRAEKRASKKAAAQIDRNATTTRMAATTPATPGVAPTETALSAPVDAGHARGAGQPAMSLPAVAEPAAAPDVPPRVSSPAHGLPSDAIAPVNPTDGDVVAPRLDSETRAPVVAPVVGPAESTATPDAGKGSTASKPPAHRATRTGLRGLFKPTGTPRLGKEPKPAAVPKPGKEPKDLKPARAPRLAKDQTEPKPATLPKPGKEPKPRRIKPWGRGAAPDVVPTVATSRQFDAAGAGGGDRRRLGAGVATPPPASAVAPKPKGPRFWKELIVLALLAGVLAYSVVHRADITAWVSEHVAAASGGPSIAPVEPAPRDARDAGTVRVAPDKDESPARRRANPRDSAESPLVR